MKKTTRLLIGLLVLVLGTLSACAQTPPTAAVTPEVEKSTTPVTTNPTEAPTPRPPVPTPKIIISDLNFQVITRENTTDPKMLSKLDSLMQDFTALQAGDQRVRLAGLEPVTPVLVFIPGSNGIDKTDNVVIAHDPDRGDMAYLMAHEVGGQAKPFTESVVQRLFRKMDGNSSTIYTRADALTSPINWVTWQADEQRVRYGSSQYFASPVSAQSVNELLALIPEEAEKDLKAEDTAPILKEATLDGKTYDLTTADGIVSLQDDFIAKAGKGTLDLAALGKETLLKTAADQSASLNGYGVSWFGDQKASYAGIVQGQFYGLVPIPGESDAYYWMIGSDETVQDGKDNYFRVLVRVSESSEGVLTSLATFSPDSRDASLAVMDGSISGYVDAAQMGLARLTAEVVRDGNYVVAVFYKTGQSKPDPNHVPYLGEVLVRR